MRLRGAGVHHSMTPAKERSKGKGFHQLEYSNELHKPDNMREEVDELGNRNAEQRIEFIWLLLILQA